MIDLSVEIGPIKLKNPVLLASGVWDFPYTKIIDFEKLGGVIYKSISLKPRDGNLPPRIAEVPYGLINSIGLENKGVNFFNKEVLPKLKNLKTNVFVSIFGETIEEFSIIASKIKDVDGIELNVSCPNVKRGGESFGKDPEMVFLITKAVCKSTSLPIIVKLPPSYTNIEELAKKAKEGGAVAVTVANTFPAIAIDIEKREPFFKGITGGLSGPAIKPISLYNVYRIKKSVYIPIIGSGGIANYKDVLEYIFAGAIAVQLGSIIFNNPLAPVEILYNLEKWMREKGYFSLKDLTK
ncbi:MAG: dihydroorotate dehydrogenase [candidate division WOR-3 bacterium]